MSYWESDWCLTPNKPISAIFDKDIGFYSHSSPKQQSAGKHSIPLEHIIPIPNQQLFALSPQCYVISDEGTDIRFIVFSLTRSGVEPTIYHTRGEHGNHYTT